MRAKIDMASPNINLRDPVIYRIRHVAHHRSGDKWCIYPLYTFAHPIEDAIENVTHSICTLEFEDQRPFYDWLLDSLANAGLFARPLPQQIEFARLNLTYVVLNLTYVVLSKRKLIGLVDQGYVDGWDDPRLPTLVGARRRGYTPEGFRLFAERIGISKSDAWIDIGVLEECMREDLNDAAERRVAVLDPVKLVITNYPESHSETCFAPNHPLKPQLGNREMPFSRELWIEREDFMEVPSKGFRRLFPGNMARLRYGYVVKCTGCEKDADGKVTAVLAEYMPDSKSGTPGADNYKVKGNLHWVSAAHACAAEVRLYDRLFAQAYPGARRDGDRGATAIPKTWSATTSTTSTPTPSASSPRSSNPRSRTRSPKPASSSSVMAISLPIAAIRVPARRCSTAPSRSRTRGPRVRNERARTLTRICDARA